MPSWQRRPAASWAYQEKCCQQSEGDRSSPLLGTVEATPGALGPALSFQVPERCGQTGEGPSKSC